MGHRVTTLNVNTIEPAGNTLTIGASGDTVVLADDVKANTYKDAGGNTLFVSNGSGVLSSVNAGFGDALKLLSTQTASNSASISFTTQLTSTYKEYIFKFINIDSGNDDVNFGFQVNASGQSGYNETITSSTFRTYNFESGGTPVLTYFSNTHQAQGTARQMLSFSLDSTLAYSNMTGELHLFNPASTTYVKHFIAQTNDKTNNVRSESQFTGGYINVAAAITNIQFTMSAGNFDGKIKMYGVA